MYSGTLNESSYVLNSTKDKRNASARLILPQAEDREERDELACR